MSAPDTNIEKQERRHKPSLLGIRGILVIVALLTIAFVFYYAINSTGPDEREGMNGAPASDVTTETIQPATEGTQVPATTAGN